MEIRKFKRFGKQQEFVCLLNKEMDSLVDNYAKRKIADLEAKLLEFAHRISDQNEEILELKQQLAEKEKEIAELEEQDIVYHNQTAIAELEKVKKLLDDCYGYEYTSLYHFIQSKAEEKIDQQIKSLKGER